MQWCLKTDGPPVVTKNAMGDYCDVNHTLTYLCQLVQFALLMVTTSSTSSHQRPAVGGQEAAVVVNDVNATTTAAAGGGGNDGGVIIIVEGGKPNTTLYLFCMCMFVDTVH